MKRLLTLAALLLAAPLAADKTVTTFGPFTAPGVSAAIYSAPSPVEEGSWSFQVSIVGAATGHLEESNDGGTTWAAIGRPFLTNELVSWPVCGACELRTRIVNTPPGSSMTIFVTVSGQTVPVTP